MAEEQLPARAQKLGDQLIGHLIAQRAVYQQRMGDVRGLGAMVACEFVHPTTGAPDADTTKRVHAAGLERGLLLLTCGVHGNVVRFLFPLTIPEAVFEEGLGLLAESIRAANI
ncbi:4-aminobutyrate aminotransferase PuuE [compost metagenome]